MPKYVIEREISGVGSATEEDLRRGSRESNSVVDDLGADIKWLHSYFTDDKLYCVFVATDEDVIREHARCLDLPADRISRVTAVTDPATGE